MKEIELIETELGRIPITIDVIKKNGEDLFVGQMFYGGHNIRIETPTRESCLFGVGNAFELEMHFWIRAEFSNIGFIHDNKISE